ncbi:PREDICTED: FK506-binding protein 4 isoform X1 [Theobroma cacao]|uniref:peptidylprolyl isomerase n=2 Tax=Theobroma cacao TaxID=3641 RepID=A0AB32UYX2_THECC|nr:PREDICTED: FK506-binding protein 4 isoform X1 [Theobroma cacao]
MAFWGIEVKPGRPFTHSPLSSRLHLSQATLGMGSSMQKSIVQCNVGNKSPVYVCCLFPDKAECCQLNLEFEEAHEVVFSVIGPRSVHLTGYYLPNSSCNHPNDESESYGEDIGESDTERSENSEESDYGGSFINDDDPPNVPSSPYLSAKSNEEIFDLKKSKNGKGTRRRLRKKYQLSESENEESSQQKVFTSAVAAAEVLDSEFEDTLPISSLCRGNNASDSGKVDVEENARKEIDNLNNNETEDIVLMSEGTTAAIGVRPESESGVRNEETQKVVLGVDDGMPKKKREVMVKEERFSEDDHGMTGKAVLEQNEQNQKLASNDESVVPNEETQKLVLGVDDGMSKKKRAVLVKEERFPEADHGMTGKAVLEQNEQNQKLPRNDESVVPNEETQKLVLGVDDGMPKKKGEVLVKEERFPEADHGMTGKAILEQNEQNQKLASDDESGVRNEETQKLVLGVDDGMPKRKREELVEEQFPEADHGMTGKAVLEQNQKPACNEEENFQHSLLLASTEVALEDGAKPMRKRKEQVEEKTFEDNVAEEDKGQKNGSNLDAVTLDVYVEDKETQSQVNEKRRKRKKRRKNKDNGDAMKMEAPLLSGIEKDRSVMDMDGENANYEAIQLSNGMIIEELEMGKPDRKLASLGKKVRVRYTGKLKESGEVFYSSAGKALLKFRLGGEEVPEVWNVGIDGMRVGGKRRLTVPPSMSYRNEGASENIPPDSWLVFDVELVKVR